MPRTITAGFPHRRQWCMIASVADTKSDLRARIRAARQQGAGAADRAHEPAGLLAAARAAGLLDPGGKPEIGAVAIAAYIAAPGEPDVAGIRAAVRQAGGVVLLPIPRADRTMDWAHDDGDYRPEGRYPIEVPAGAVVGSGAAGLLAHGVRTVLVPALAVDATGVRLGQGGGYYDRLLSELATLAALTRLWPWTGCDSPGASGRAGHCGGARRRAAPGRICAARGPRSADDGRPHADAVRGAGPLSRAGAARSAGQDAAGVDEVDELEPESEPDPELDDDPEDPLDDDGLLASEDFFDSVLGVAGEVAEDLPRLSVR